VDHAAEIRIYENSMIKIRPLRSGERGAVLTTFYISDYTASSLANQFELVSKSNLRSV
jgi:hypothetical protein